ncbi:helix-turn-helix domain-containing protein [Solirubrum puertoriconensis]|uniref:HTH araC/xylS-type domain-containing protein n=1 Tax=Solirubrum puertoriconensis TaxID=1751427 RepID=A0A9X0HJS0_SOLP1|nr:AraC family transcriptional regulator [Solirubrum puertoriconensis]KUG07214.1 hypothetical protein ASU33_12635 [Solirubrum puertoriconensis]
MVIQLPHYFREQADTYRTIELNASTLASYRRNEDSRNNQVHLSENLLLLVVGGQKIVRTPGQPDLVVKAGEGAFIRKGLYLMSSLCADEQPYESVLFFLHEEPVRQFIGQYAGHFAADAAPDDHNPPAALPFAIGPVLEGYVRSVQPYFEQPAAAPQPLLQLKFQELLLHFVLAPDGARFREFLLRINHAASYDLRLLMEQNFQRPFSLAEFAFLSGRSLSSFKRDFSSTFGQPPAQWLKARRLEQARFLLRTTSLSVGQVGDEVGFASTSHFVQAYKERFQHTPGQAVA